MSFVGTRHAPYFIKISYLNEHKTKIPIVYLLKTSKRHNTTQRSNNLRHDTVITP